MLTLEILIFQDCQSTAVSICVLSEKVEALELSEHY